MADGADHDAPTTAPMSVEESRLLGFLAAHPTEWASDVKREATAKNLQRRLCARTWLAPDDRGRMHTEMIVTQRGIDIAAALRLRCPGRESGECEECRRGGE